MSYTTNNNLGISHFCTQFSGVPCFEPEPYASSIDVLTASQEVEKAIHSPNRTSTVKYLNSAMTWLQHAYDYFSTAKLYAYQSRTEQVMTLLNNIITRVKSASNLSAFQNNVIYGYMGVLSSLYKDIQNL